MSVLAVRIGPREMEFNQQETALYDGRPEWKAYSFLLGLAVILAITVYGIPVSFIIVIYVALDIYQYRYRVSDQRITVSTGIFSKKTYEIDINDIRSINVSQTFMQRVLNIGDLEFTTAAGPLKEAVMISIKEPEKLKEAIRRHKIR
jgi:uncharacterized membrane protein YdbT with pleckstrin-like domain